MELTVEILEIGIPVILVVIILTAVEQNWRVFEDNLGIYFIISP